MCSELSNITEISEIGIIAVFGKGILWCNWIAAILHDNAQDLDGQGQILAGAWFPKQDTQLHTWEGLEAVLSGEQSEGARYLHL